jgi:glycyl-tRNA synthetase beta chain
MTTTKNLLVELFVEELPPKSLKKLGESFAEVLADSLRAQGLVANDAIITAYASPRRLAAHITNVASQSPSKEILVKLMPKKVGLNESGERTDALNKRLSKEGYLRDDHTMHLEEVDEKGVVYVALRKTEQPLPLAVALQQALGIALFKLPIAKMMTYQLSDGWDSVSFVRPAHGLVALYGAEEVRLVQGPIQQLGLQAGRTTQGHRFEANVAKVVLKDADSYAQQLETEGAVIPSFAKRRAEIAKQIAAVAAKEKLKPIEDDALLDEVTALVERPNVLVGTFEKEFLEVPQECLILTMKANQKYFPLLDSKGKLTNRFLIVSNIRPADPSLVIGGNERVVRPRLADAKFFFDQDRKKTLASRVEGLRKVVYHNKLGTQGDRVERVWAIAQAIGLKLGGGALAAQAGEAAMLAKADLLTDMVGEFPELQGIMGRYYAQHDGLSDDIAFAIEDHYRPRFSGDGLPRNMVGVCVALADKLETLLGMFGIGEIPTGDQDRFALRRHALGVIRMLIEKDLNLPIDALVRDSFSLMPSVAMTLGPNAKGTYGLQKDTPDSVLNFIYERLSGYLREQGYSAQEVEAVLTQRPERLSDVPKRLAAVRSFAALPEAAALAAANKRVGNILKKEGIGANVDAVNGKLLKEPAEQALHQALSKIAPKADAAFKTGDYTGSLQALAALRAPVDEFFDNVMVNVEDAPLRANRLALLSQLHQAMNRVADISKLAT